MLADLKLSPTYDGLIYLAEAERNLPFLKSHRHAELELNLVLRGSITYLVAGQRHTFTQGTLLWIFPAQEHQLIDRSADARFYVAVFKSALIKQSCRGREYAGLKGKNVKSGGLVSRQLSIEHIELLRKMMDALIADAPDSDLLNREAGFGVQSDFRYEHRDPDALNAGLRYLLILSWRYSRSGAERDNAVKLHPGVSRALKLLGESGPDLALDRVAARSGMSAAYLSRLFHHQVGMPLNHYRNSVRLSRFMDHFTQPGHKTILESVFAAGFGSYAQFYKVFVKTYGFGPGRYLRRDGQDAKSRAAR